MYAVYSVAPDNPAPLQLESRLRRSGRSRTPPNSCSPDSSDVVPTRITR